MVDLRTELRARNGASTSELVRKHGREAVADEIRDMIFYDLADDALKAAIHLGDSISLISGAAQVVQNGGYGEKAKELAKHPTLENLKKIYS